MPRLLPKEQDGLSQDWGTRRVFCNPPYGKTMLAWARKCYEALRGGALIVLLPHARTDTRWFHDWVYGKGRGNSLRTRSPEVRRRQAVGALSVYGRGLPSCLVPGGNLLAQSPGF